MDVSRFLSSCVRDSNNTLNWYFQRILPPVTFTEKRCRFIGVETYMDSDEVDGSFVLILGVRGNGNLRKFTTCDIALQCLRFVD